MRRLFLRDCAPGDVVEDVFVLTNKQLAATASGKYYIKAFCSDRTGQMTVRLWNATKDIFNSMPDGGFLRIRGRIENYQNNLQLIIEKNAAPRKRARLISPIWSRTRRKTSTRCASGSLSSAAASKTGIFPRWFRPSSMTKS